MGVVTTDRNTAKAWLEQTVKPGTTPVLPDSALDTALDTWRVVDAAGRAPIDPDYVPTWNLHYLAGELFEQKAGMAVVTKTATLSSWSSEGSSVARREGSTAADFWGLAAYHKRLAFPTGPVSIIDLGPALGPVPRSAYEGVTPDAHRF